MVKVARSAMAAAMAAVAMAVEVGGRGFIEGAKSAPALSYK